MIEIIDPEMEAVVAPGEEIIEIGTGFQFTEGSVWLNDQNCLLFSDIRADTIYKWSSKEGISIRRRPSHRANGNTIDGKGRLITCEHKTRRVTRTEPDGGITILTQSYLGKRLNSPNDVVVKRDGSIWFTDPPYGIEPEMQEQLKNNVFRFDHQVGEPVPVVEDFSKPNGLCFSPDESFLYIADSDIAIHHIRRFRVLNDNRLESEGVFAVIEPGFPDGIRVDSKGRLYATAGDGIQVFSTDGNLIGKIHTPQAASNCTFGGSENCELFITARQSVFRVTLRAKGAI